ncbi:MAG: ribosome silencing factor [Chloroflexota bacterium]
METIELARKIVDLVSDQQGSDVALLDVREACTYTDYVVICGGESERQIESIEQEIHNTLKQEGIAPPRTEGEGSGWVLMDLGEVIIHIFAPAERSYYQLDKLWDKAVTVVRVL